MQRPGEITYYEELGVESDATPEEIREAFRALVRLMHPDQQTDEQLRLMADWQMRKINRIYAVLSDPDRRRRYDRSLEAPAAPAPIVITPEARSNPHRLVARFAWIGAVAALVLVLFWLASDAPSPTSVSLVDHINAQAPSPQTRDEIYLLRSELNAVKAQRDAALREVAQLRVLPRSRRLESPAQTGIVTEPAAISIPAPPPGAAVPISAPALPGLPQNKFLGFWFYSRPSQGQQNKNKALYPPEFIEATITEQGALVHGRYRSRYQIADRAISPDVNFEFVASPAGSTIVCPWLGPGGARGELTLKLTGENTMEVAWTATELGSSQGLSSGTARLTRRVD